LSRDTGDRGALQWLVELSQKLMASHTETRRVCENMVIDVVVSIGCDEIVDEVAPPILLRAKNIHVTGLGIFISGGGSNFPHISLLRTTMILHIHLEFMTGEISEF
jgi:hypothetical protein